MAPQATEQTPLNVNDINISRVDSVCSLIKNSLLC
jgi:hypothetical protein